MDAYGPYSPNGALTLIRSRPNKECAAWGPYAKTPSGKISLVWWDNGFWYKKIQTIGWLFPKITHWTPESEERILDSLRAIGPKIYIYEEE
jgi:hypothetical protein